MDTFKTCINSYTLELMKLFKLAHPDTLFRPHPFLHKKTKTKVLIRGSHFSCAFRPTLMLPHMGLHSMAIFLPLSYSNKLTTFAPPTVFGPNALSLPNFWGKHNEILNSWDLRSNGWHTWLF